MMAREEMNGAAVRAAGRRGSGKIMEGKQGREEGDKE